MKNDKIKTIKKRPKIQKKNLRNERNVSERKKSHEKQ